MRIIHFKKVHKFSFRRPVVVIGIFDGVHRGHQQLIKQAVFEARKIKGTAIVYTFWPHPDKVLHKDSSVSLIVSLKYRLKLLSALGVDVCFVIPFTKKFSQLAPEQFVRKYLVSTVAPYKVYVGYDFRFGQNRTGDFDLFQRIGQRHGFGVQVLSAIKGNQRIISSTLIRSLIMRGDLRKASGLLGRSVSIMGTVHRGDSRGKLLGFPTANIDPDNEVIPPKGVYAVRVARGKKTYKGMANIGQRPSFVPGNPKINIEVHLFNFKKDIYGESIVVEFVRKIRSERTFRSRDEFVTRLNRDKEVALRILRS